MKVLLWQDIESLGKRGDVVVVKDGFARNYLIPRRLASKPTASMHKEFEIEKRRQDKLDATLVAEASVVAEKLQAVPSISIEVNTNEEGHLYGSVTPTMIAEALKDHGLKVEPKTIEISEAIKNVGTYEVTVKLHRNVQPKVKVWVLSSKALKPEEKAAGEPAS